MSLCKAVLGAMGPVWVGKSLLYLTPASTNQTEIERKQCKYTFCVLNIATYRNCYLLNHLTSFNISCHTLLVNFKHQDNKT